jgi:hypothetical protein
VNPGANVWWIGPLVLTLLRLLYTEGRLSRAAFKNGSFVFRAGIGLRLLFMLGICGFTVGIVLSIGREEFWLLAMGAALVISVCFAWPATITVDDAAITRSLWWRRLEAIPWKQVSAIECNAGGDLQVFGNHGQSITFTRYHVDPTRFQEEVLKRAELPHVITTSAPPTLRG